MMNTPIERSGADDRSPIDLRSDWDAALDAFLAERIYDFNARATGLFDGKALNGSIKDPSGNVIAAVTGHTWGGTCQVTSLWVDESHRRVGLGRALMHAVEAEARRRGCTQLILFTHTFQAPAFYERLGFLKQATIANYPAGHAQLLYVKGLEPTMAHDPASEAESPRRGARPPGVR
jgi:ribosomal protein S18 acetylase RimI-like enzyme